MTKKRPCELCNKTHYTQSAVLKCGRRNKHKQIELSLSSSSSSSSSDEIMEEISDMNSFLTNSQLLLIKLNRSIDSMVSQQNKIKKKMKNIEIKRKEKQIRENKNIQMVQGFEENLKIDIDSIRIMIITTKLDVLSKKMRLSRTFVKHRDPQCKNWFMIVDEPFYLSIPEEKYEKFIKSLKQKCHFRESEHFVTATTIWVETSKIMESLMENKINVIRLNSHGLKSTNFEWIEEIISPDSRNSFDFGIYSQSIPKSLLFTFFHNTHNSELFPMLGYSTLGNQQLEIGFEDIPSKIYSTLIHHLKYEARIDWAFSKNMSNKVLRRKLNSIEDFIKNLDEQKDFPMRLEVTVKQKIVDGKFENFKEILENAESYLKVLKRKFDEMMKIKVSISTYKNRVFEEVERLRAKLKRDEEKVSEEELDEFAYLENCVGWYHFMIKSRINRFLKREPLALGEFV